MRRIVDVVAGGLGGLLLVPVAAVVAVVIRCRCGSPVLFRQLRAGRRGEPFTILKFRTMRPERFPGEPDAERLTPLGRALRSSSLDELPQLWNVLRGEMSLIGPRPTLPEQVVHYSPRQRGRLAVRPGLTGWAQVRGRNALSWPERIELDLWYLAHRSVLLDLRIVALTVLRLLRPSGITGPGGHNPGFPAPAGGGQPRGRAGTPTTTWSGSTSRVTTAPAPTNTPVPTDSPCRTAALLPTVTPDASRTDPATFAPG
jgi:lipopolysaccharide/colanic/teichoic acid biosynthesis glycosyltransferase